MSLRYTSGLFNRAAQNPLNLGQGNAALSAGCGEEGKLAQSEPTADGPGVNAYEGGYLADAEKAFHALTLYDIKGIK